jgi:hypothetical protein
MNNLSAKSILRTASALLVLALPSVMPGAAGASEPTAATTALHALRERLPGVWDSTVTTKDCTTGTPLMTFRAMNQSAPGGSVVATSTVAPYPSLGTWRRLEGRSYSAEIRFFRYDATGVFLGPQQTTRTIELSETGDAYTSEAFIEVFDTSDNLISTFCADEAATRLF